MISRFVYFPFSFSKLIAQMKGDQYIRSLCPQKIQLLLLLYIFAPKFLLTLFFVTNYWRFHLLLCFGSKNLDPFEISHLSLIIVKSLPELKIEKNEVIVKQYYSWQKVGV